MPTCTKKFKHLLIMGAFNFPEVDCLQDNFLFQEVIFNTRYREGQQPSLLDLVIVNEEHSLLTTLLQSKSPPGKSDHIVSEQRQRYRGQRQPLFDEGRNHKPERQQQENSEATCPLEHHQKEQLYKQSVVDHWNMLPKTAVEVASINAFKGEIYAFFSHKKVRHGGLLSRQNINVPQSMHYEIAVCKLQ